jgi:putative transcriptional regulator
MPTIWNLRNVLKERGINRAAEISRLIGKRTGYQLSTQAVCDLLNTEPKMIRIETIQAFCDAFYLRLGDVLDVLPSAAEKRRKRMGNQDFAAFYPNAREYSSES